MITNSTAERPARPLTRDLRVDTGVDHYLDQDPKRPPALHLADFVQANAVGKRLLDYGCGIGAYSHELRARGFECVGVDANREYIEIARRNGNEALLIGGGSLPFSDASFDTTFFLEVLEHLPDPILLNALSEARRVTKSKVLATVPDNTQTTALLGHGFLFGHFQAIDHVQFFTQDGAKNLLSRFFSRVEVRRGDPVFPHRLLPPMIRKPLSLGYRIGLLRPTIFSRLFIEAWV
jgi:SAM-dependent methyltransferase